MSLDQRSETDDLTEVAAVLGIPDAAAASIDETFLRKYPQRQLLEACQRLGIKGVAKLTKDALVKRLAEAFAVKGRKGNGLSRKASPRSVPSLVQPREEAEPTRTPSSANEEPAPSVLSHKFELGERGGPAEEPRTIPWSYGQDRVTGMPVDPDRLYVYWEVTDEAIATARASLGAGGPGAWVNLRVYDITGRIFDGTNAHSYFDHKVERHERQWFFHIGKPSSQAVVEVGLRSHEGFFVKTSRSGIVDFPRRSPVGWGDPEWMTVRSASGPIELAGSGPAGQASGQGGAPAAFDPLPLWHMRALGEEALRLEETGSHERVEWEEVWGNGVGEEAHRTFAWESPVMVSSWESGPYTYPVEVPTPTSESYEGALKVYRVQGRTHVVYGPWQVVIRGLGAQYSREVIARWQVQRSWVAEEGHEVRGVRVTAHQGAGGSSELLAAGASERRWRGESELRMRGASEQFYLGASERRMMGASESLFAGASQFLMRGASERLQAGQSEVRMLGASERMLAGGSERRLSGGSEGRLAGSEGRLSRPESDGEQADPGEPGRYPPPPQTSRSNG
jgi:hypothetical protein